MFNIQKLLELCRKCTETITHLFDKASMQRRGKQWRFNIYFLEGTGRKFHLLDLELNGVKIKGLIVAAKNFEVGEKSLQKGKLIP